MPLSKFSLALIALLLIPSPATVLAGDANELEKSLLPALNKSLEGHFDFVNSRVSKPFDDTIWLVTYRVKRSGVYTLSITQREAAPGGEPRDVSYDFGMDIAEKGTPRTVRASQHQFEILPLACVEDLVILPIVANDTSREHSFELKVSNSTEYATPDGNSTVTTVRLKTVNGAEEQLQHLGSRLTSYFPSQSSRLWNIGVGADLKAVAPGRFNLVSRLKYDEDRLGAESHISLEVVPADKSVCVLATNPGWFYELPNGTDGVPLTTQLRPADMLHLEHDERIFVGEDPPPKNLTLVLAKKRSSSSPEQTSSP